MLSFKGGMWICIHIPLVMQNLEEDLSLNSLRHHSLYTKVGLIYSSKTFLYWIKGQEWGDESIQIQVAKKVPGSNPAWNKIYKMKILTKLECCCLVISSQDVSMEIPILVGGALIWYSNGKGLIHKPWLREQAVKTYDWRMVSSWSLCNPSTRRNGEGRKKHSWNWSLPVLTLAGIGKPIILGTHLKYKKTLSFFSIFPVWWILQMSTEKYGKLFYQLFDQRCHFDGLKRAHSNPIKVNNFFYWLTCRSWLT